jgi:CDP-diacylglycerol--glycerol-3-phosphate 3-phosphatidyltransferase
MAVPKNLPNVITGGRVVLATVLFGLLWLIDHGRVAVDPEVGGLAAFVVGHERLLFNVSLAIFLVAAISDVVDGYIARRWGLQSDFGRIVDPFADKVMICGTFVELIPLEGSQVGAWMVVLILARELLVDGLRGFAEAKGLAFPAMKAGKFKMFTQCLTLAWILFALGNLPGVLWAAQVTFVLIAIMLLVTAYSGVVYVYRARKVLAEHASTLAAA